jgi:hypothetical protein
MRPHSACQVGCVRSPGRARVQQRRFDVGSLRRRAEVVVAPAVVAGLAGQFGQAVDGAAERGAGVARRRRNEHLRNGVSRSRRSLAEQFRAVPPAKQSCRAPSARMQPARHLQQASSKARWPAAARLAHRKSVDAGLAVAEAFRAVSSIRARAPACHLAGFDRQRRQAQGAWGSPCGARPMTLPSLPSPGKDGLGQQEIEHAQADQARIVAVPQLLADAQRCARGRRGRRRRLRASRRARRRRRPSTR